MTSTRGSESNGPLSLIYSFPHAIGAPGIGWTAWNQVTELVRAGHRVHLVTASVARPIEGLASLHRTLEVAGARVPHRVIGRDRAFALHDRRGASLVRRIRPEVVHTWPLAARRTLEQARLHGAVGLREAPNTHTAHAYRVVAEECALLGVTLPASASHATNAAHLAIERAEWRAAHAVLAPSDAVAASFVAEGHDPDRLLRHQYGYRADPTAPTTRADGGRRFTAVFLGRVEPRKGLHYALEAWSTSTASRGGRFLVYGDVLPGYAEYLEPLLGLPGVEVRPFTSDPAAALRDADVLVLPTIEEGSALVTYEAQAVGCIPLVSTAAGALLDDGVHGLLHEPRDVATLRSQLDLLHASPQERHRLSRNAAAHAPELTWERAGAALVEAYRTALARGAEWKAHDRAVVG